MQFITSIMVIYMSLLEFLKLYGNLACNDPKDVQRCRGLPNYFFLTVH